MMFTLYHADCTGNAGNCLYPHAVEISDASSLAGAVSRDYVCAEYRGNHRSCGNFIASNCLAADCDNDHSEDPQDWKTPADVAEAFPGVAFAVHYSRNHMKAKNGKKARPKFHVLFPIDRVTDAGQYASLKKQMSALFAYFDANALDAARFFFGTGKPQVAIFDGPMTLTTFLKDLSRDTGAGETGVIPEGSRNSELSKGAAKILKRFGDTQEARDRFERLAARCRPPLGEEELETIWRSALGFLSRIASQEGYIPPERYNSKPALLPADLSDVGQAAVLAREYSDRLRYSPATGHIFYNGCFWEESAPKAQGIAQKLTDRQLEEADIAMQKAKDSMVATEAWDILGTLGPKRSAGIFTTQQTQAYEQYQTASEYRNYAIRRRDSRSIAASLKEARPMLEIDPKQLDADAFLLNTPSATYDLREGIASAREHRAEDFITKCTSADPSDAGAELWKDTLHTIFCGNAEVIGYVQQIAGLAAIGRVCAEAMIISYGQGSNGKSTFWNTLARVMGTYSGTLSADALTVGCRRNVKPELAEIRGKRLVIAAELEEGMRLNTSTVKQLCSTDEINAEKKYKDPFAFVPSHTLVLYTNHLPKVGTNDTGTWRRLIVIPFTASIKGSSDIKNYAEHLYNEAAGAILTWIIEGAGRVIANEYHIEQPKVVREAIAGYRENNDWLAHFLEDRCEVDISFSVSSGEVYSAYREYCMQTGEYTRSTTDFYTALESAGFERRRTKHGIKIHGFRIKSDLLQ